MLRAPRGPCRAPPSLPSVILAAAAGGQAASLPVFSGGSLARSLRREQLPGDVQVACEAKPTEAAGPHHRAGCSVVVLQSVPNIRSTGWGGGRLLPTPDPTELVTGSWGWDRKEASAAPRTRGKFADNGVVPLKSPKKPAEKVLVKTKPLTSPRGHRGPLGTGRQPRQGSPLSRVRGPGRGASGGQPEEHATVSLLGTTDDGRNC